MTGRRLYDLFCDARIKRPRWQREEITRLGLKEPFPAWPFLEHHEREIFNDMARRLKGVRR